MDTSNTTNWIIIGAVAVVILLGGWWLFMGKADDTQGSAATTTGNGATTTTNGGSATTTGGASMATTTPAGETVTAANQAAGSTVAIGSMNLTRESWVIVRDTMSILGAGRFSPGTATGTVKLLRPTVAGQTYQVMVYVDDGDKKFDFKVDALVLGIGTSFVAQ